jgi:hypothetical protein
MCGGAPKADPVKPPTPAAIPELVLDKEGQAKKKAKKGQSQLQRGRNALVTPGLSISGPAPTPRPAGGLGIRGRRGRK